MMSDKLPKKITWWEEIPDEELFEDGELELSEVLNKIKYHLFVQGDWKIMRRNDA